MKNPEIKTQDVIRILAGTPVNEIYEGARHHTAADVMTTEVVCVDVEDTVGHAAWLMAQRNIKRLPVLKNGRLAGILSRADIIRLLARDEE